MSETHSIPETTIASEVETVRCIIENSAGDVLLLQKSPESKAPNLFEFPGGKIDNITGNVSTHQEQVEAVRKEVLEEIGIDITAFPLEDTGDYSYSFYAGEKQHKRKVYVFSLQVPDEIGEVTVNQTKTLEGASEDNHTQATWVSRAVLRQLQEEGKLSGNSQLFERKDA